MNVAELIETQLLRERVTELAEANDALERERDEWQARAERAEAEGALHDPGRDAMTDDERQARIDAIRARVDAATPGPWHMAICCDEHGEVEGYANIEAGNRDVANEASDDDAALIANAPADLAWLLAEFAAAQAREQALRDAGNALADAAVFASNQFDAVGAWADERLSARERRELMALMAKWSGYEAVIFKRWRAALAAAGGEGQG